MTRLSDWQGRLSAYVADLSGRPFSWGTLDCAIFVAGAVKAMTGVDHRAEFGTYDSRVSATRVVRDAGFADHIALVASLFDEAPRPRAGDIVVLPGKVLGIWQGQRAFAIGPDGWGHADYYEVQRTFRV